MRYARHYPGKEQGEAKMEAILRICSSSRPSALNNTKATIFEPDAYKGKPVVLMPGS